MSCNCPEPCLDCNECPSNETPVYQPLPLCWAVPPCNEGCADTLNTDCITIAKTTGIFVKGQSLTTALTNLSNYLSALAIIYNQTNNPRLVTYGISIDCPNFSVIVKRNNITQLAQTYSSIETFLTALQAIESGWTRQDTYLYIADTATWEITLSCN